MPKTYVIPSAAELVSRRQAGLLSTAQCEQLGIGREARRRLVRQVRWTSPARGVYDTDPVPLASRVRDNWFEHAARWRTWFALLLHGPDAVATGCCALVLHGVAGLPRDFPLEVARKDRSPRRTKHGAAVVAYAEFPTDLIEERAIARIDHAAAQALPRLPRQNALAALHDLVRRRHGAAQLHALFPLVDGRSESPAESFARLSCHDNGVPPDDLQVRVVRGGKVVARVDFAWRLPDGRWLVVEIDGLGPHSTQQALVRDAPRQNLLTASGRVIVLRFKPSDNDRPGGVGSRIAKVLRKHGWTPPREATGATRIYLDDPAPVAAKK
ncbi:type IV toxin-antitoxin system AbiEi family antitoxin domain-containing protein [Promicromonospora kroppenstedtii]|uniref:type IV toxin-antitoxin system AbiEi family antitoxin domain-containing protein n=1 Tax=Promicromonospora kroppenstedtii TaxID=440482 RepID=UPI0004B5CFFD|nr:type IV toxin-antitoxin system AbiEi family antitoxin domain-containing protein [Promicromonospora kroppenstedtii]